MLCANTSPDSRIWPFETGWRPLTSETLAPLSCVYAEVYPSTLPVVQNADEVLDAAQVRACVSSSTRLIGPVAWAVCLRRQIETWRKIHIKLRLKRAGFLQKVAESPVFIGFGPFSRISNHGQ